MIVIAIIGIESLIWIARSPQTDLDKSIDQIIAPIFSITSAAVGALAGVLTGRSIASKPQDIPERAIYIALGVLGFVVVAGT